MHVSCFFSLYIWVTSSPALCPSSSPGSCITTETLSSSLSTSTHCARIKVLTLTLPSQSAQSAPHSCVVCVPGPVSKWLVTGPWQGKHRHGKHAFSHSYASELSPSFELSDDRLNLDFLYVPFTFIFTVIFYHILYKYGYAID